MSEIHELSNLLQMNGMTLVGMLYENDFWTVYAHNPKSVGRKPDIDECRDAQDYLLLLDQWKQKGEFAIYSAQEFGDAILGAIEAVKGY
jgi:hypothetical protein